MVVNKKSELSDYGFERCFIEVNNLCNMACLFCNHPQRKSEKQSLDFSLVKQIIQELADGLNPREVGFNVYNEPLLYGDLFRCFDACRSVGLNTLLTTNGMLLSGKNINRILDSPPSSIRISLQVLSRERHNVVRGCLMPYDVYVNTIAKAVAVFIESLAGVDVRIDVATAKRFTGVRSWLLPLGFVDPGDSSIQPQGKDQVFSGLDHFLRLVASYSKRFVYDSRQLEASVQSLFEVASGVSLVYALSENVQVVQKEFFDHNRYQYFPVKYGSCASSELCILSNGNVVPCCMDCFGDIRLGNVNKMSLRSILERNKEFIVRLRSANSIDHPLCMNCLGAPSYLGSKIKGIYNFAKYISKKS